MLKRKDAYTVAVVGATGAVGQEIIEILEERNFPAASVRLFASERSEGKRVEFMGKTLKVEVLRPDVFEGIDMALFSAGGVRSREFAPAAVRAGCIVIDNSSVWRMDPEVPLVVPEVNPGDLKKHRGIIANPNCSTIQMVLILKPIHDAARIRRVVVTTFQSVSGTGMRAMEELLQQSVNVLNMKEVSRAVYPHQIAFNVLPHIDAFTETGDTMEETKLVNETRKILGDEALRVTATTVRVPVFRGHSESLNIETEKALSPEECRALLAGSPGVVVFDVPEKNVYPVPLEVAGKDDVYVGRVRRDPSIPNGLNLWVVGDNLRKGAALNAVQIAETLIDGA